MGKINAILAGGGYIIISFVLQADRVSLGL